MNEKDYFEEPAGQYKKEKDFTSLLCWQDARVMKLFFYNEIIPKLPSYEEGNLSCLNLRIKGSSHFLC